jgi:hypothetical protein
MPKSAHVSPENGDGDNDRIFVEKRVHVLHPPNVSIQLTYATTQSFQIGIGLAACGTACL